jgi:hypothetical protein
MILSLGVCRVYARSGEGERLGGFDHEPRLFVAVLPGRISMRRTIRSRPGGSCRPPPVRYGCVEPRRVGGCPIVEHELQDERLLMKLRPRTRDRTAWDKANDSAWDARTGSMLEGKGLSPTGAVMDFESDSKRPK